MKRSLNAIPFRAKQVAILVETDDSWGPSVVSAICKYASCAGWTLLIGPHDNQGRLRLPSNWEGDGAVVALRNKAMVQHVQRFQLPVVDVSHMVPKADWFARVATDNAVRAKMAFEHLDMCGLTHFAC